MVLRDGLTRNSGYLLGCIPAIHRRRCIERINKKRLPNDDRLRYHHHSRVALRPETNGLWQSSSREPNSYILIIGGMAMTTLYRAFWKPVSISVLACCIAISATPVWATSIVVKAGDQDRVECPIEVKAPAGLSLNGTISLVESGSKAKVPATIEDGMLSFVLPKLKAGKSATFELSAETQTALPVTFKHDKAKQVVDILINGQLFTEFHYESAATKPYLWPVNGPTVGKTTLNMTRDYPMLEVDKTKDERLSTDHVHHRSVWSAHGDVNGENTWHDAGLDKTTLQRVTNIELKPGAGYGEMIVDIDWIKAGKTDKLLTEKRIYRFYNTPSTGRLMDLDLTVVASEEPLHFGDTKEGGFFSIRTNDLLTVENGGTLTNSEGNINSEGDNGCWGKQADWVDYSGVLEGVKCGMTIFDHPSSFRYPAYWHARAYGLLTANVFGLSHFNKGKEGASQDGSYDLEKGKSLFFKYRFYVHADDCQGAKVADRYADFVNPPQVTWK